MGQVKDLGSFSQQSTLMSSQLQPTPKSHLVGPEHFGGESYAHRVLVLFLPWICLFFVYIQCS